MKHSLLFSFIVAFSALGAESGSEVAGEFLPVDPADIQTPLPITNTSRAEPAINQNDKREKPQPAEADDGKPQVRLVGIETDVAKKYVKLIPDVPIDPIQDWRRWIKNQENAVHCALEWRDDKGNWFRGELRSTTFDINAEQYRVGWGEFPGTAYDSYGIYIMPGRVPRDKDSQGRPVVVAVDEKVDCSFHDVERELRQYASKNKKPGEPGTGGNGKRNRGLGGPAYKPSQNSNTMINFILRTCGVKRAAPENAVGWDTEPHFPYSTDADAPETDIP